MSAFLQSLTSEQLAALTESFSSLTELVLFAAFVGGLVGANLGGLFEFLTSIFARASSAVFGPRRATAQALRDVQRERRFLLLRARVLRREAVKLEQRLTAPEGVLDGC